MTSSSGFRGWRNALSIGLVIALLAGGAAEARRGGSFGSRGSRTYSAPRATSTYSGSTGGVQRSMTDPSVRPTYGASGYAAPLNQPYSPYSQPYNAYPQRGGLFHGFGGGLLAGGLLGLMAGHGFGGWGGGYGGYGGYGAGSSIIGLIFQLGILFLIGWFVLRLFRRRSGAGLQSFGREAFDMPYQGGYGGTSVPQGAGPVVPNVIPMPGPAMSSSGDEIGLTQADKDSFERLLGEVQTAFANEDYAGLRERCTPEIVSYLSEELSENATHGHKNDVTNTRLLQSDVSESWREGDADYATMAMRYESIDVMRDRQTGAIVEGDPDHPTQTTELWTFVRHAGPWKLSAIQETQ